MEPRNFRQLGLDFAPEEVYIELPEKENETLNSELFEALEAKLDELLGKYAALKEENSRLCEENHRLGEERQGLKSRIDAILSKLEGI
jgi:cell division protein ZapB